MDHWIPQRIQRSTLRKQHSQLRDMNCANERNIDPEENSDAPFDPVDDTEDAETQGDFDEPETSDVFGLRDYAPFYRRIGSGDIKALDMLSETCADPFCGDKGAWEANGLFRLISTSRWIPKYRSVESLLRPE